MAGGSNFHDIIVYLVIAEDLGDQATQQSWIFWLWSVNNPQLQKWNLENIVNYVEAINV